MRVIVHPFGSRDAPYGTTKTRPAPAITATATRQKLTIALGIFYHSTTPRLDTLTLASTEILHLPAYM